MRVIIAKIPKVPALPKFSIIMFISELTMRQEVHKEKVASELMVSPEI